MTVGELIAALQALDPSLPVVGRGFDENDYDDTAAPRPIRLVRLEKQVGRSGKYTDPSDDPRNRFQQPAVEGSGFDAILLDPQA